jgi:hypothetical protein
VAVVDDGCGMKGCDAAEWELLAEGTEERPSGNAEVSFFNTGHFVSMGLLGHEVIIATAAGGVGTLVRWGEPVSEAVHRECDAHAHKLLENAAIEFNMSTGALKKTSPRDDGA